MVVAPAGRQLASAPRRERHETGVELADQLVAGRGSDNHGDDQEDDGDTPSQRAGGSAGSARHRRQRAAKGVSHAAQRVDELGLDVVDLPAQVTDVGLDDAPVAAEVVVPDVVEDLRLGDGTTLVDQQVAGRLYSVGDNATSSPARRTRWASSSITRSAHSSTLFDPGRSEVRRSTAWKRAISSSRLNSFCR